MSGMETDGILEGLSPQLSRPSVRTKLIPTVVSLPVFDGIGDSYTDTLLR